MFRSLPFILNSHYESRKTFHKGNKIETNSSFYPVLMQGIFVFQQDTFGFISCLLCWNLLWIISLYVRFQQFPIKKARSLLSPGFCKIWRLPTLPLLRSTIGAGGLNFSVRNGKRWNPAAITTLNLHRVFFTRCAAFFCAANSFRHDGSFRLWAGRGFFVQYQGSPEI